MRSLLGRFHRPMSRGLVNNMLTMNNLGDGSTLSLDFTTGVLDPRLTFSRASPATFVNSSGYVQFANANCFTYSNPRFTGTAWNGTGTVTWNGIGGLADPIGGTNAQSFTLGTTASAIFNTAGTIVVSGITHTFSVWLRAASGTTNARIGSANTGVISTVALTTTWQRFSCQYVTNGTNDGGAIYSQTVTATPEIYVWGAQIQPGSIVGDLIQTSGTQNYSTPRFDYSPTNIGEPRGLLIEAQGLNLTTRSEDFANADWTKDNSGGSAPVVTTVSATNPANGSTVNQIVFDKTGGVFSRIGRTSTGTVSTPYTMSVWMRTVSGSANVGLRIGADPAGFNCAVTTTWKRFQYTYTLSSTDSSAQIMLWDNIIGNDETATVYVWGCQVELGSGASSYIPTGASQVTRTADYLLSASSSGASRVSEFSLDDLAPGTSALNEHTVLWTYGRDSNSKQQYPASLYARTNVNTERIDLRDFSGTTVEAGTQTRSVQTVTVGTASIVKIAIAQSTSAYPSSAINGTSATLTSGVIDSALGLQWVQLCNSSAIASAFNPIWARQLKVYPTALTAAQLQTITAL